MKFLQTVPKDFPGTAAQPHAPATFNATIEDFLWLNWRGLWTLFAKEVRRFTKIWGQTLISPLIMTLLFYAVFALGFGKHPMPTGQGSLLTFIVPGLVMMAVAQNAFMNTSVSLVLSKLQGNIVDILMPPLSPFELTAGYLAGGLARGLLVGAVSLGVLALIEPLPVFNVWIALYFAVMGSLMLAAIGLITGILGNRFDHLGAVQNLVIMPATFLSGTFYSISQLPDKWRIFCQLNPFYYMIDGFRYGLTGQTDIPLWGGMALLLCVNLALFNVAYWLFAQGAGLKQ
ncbi:MAG: multidrug ABC transporter permease [Proteobacteria bacterium]|nr:multidrug ABC transporter permease [Pseudomonadota bacterium]